MTRPNNSMAVERVGPGDQSHPTATAREADSSLSSRHSRLADHLLAPEEDFDSRRAARLCAEVCRLALEELAPGLILIRAAEREQLQARAAYLFALFDFAQQHGMEGERLSQINRWEFNLELALEGSPIGQPIFVHLAKCYEEKPWPDRHFKRLGALARYQAASEEGLKGEALSRWFLLIGGALREQFLGQEAPEELDPIVAAVAKAHWLKRQSLLHLRSRPTMNTLDSWPGSEADRAASGVDIEPLQLELRAGLRSIKLVPGPYRKATAYALRASHAMLERCKIALDDQSSHSLQLGIFSRLYLLFTSYLRKA